MNKFDNYEWIKKVIDSCQNFYQWARCIKLIQRYEIMYPSLDDDYLKRGLRDHHHTKLKTYTKDEIQKGEEIHSQY